MILCALGDVNGADRLRARTKARLARLLPKSWPDIKRAELSTSRGSVDSFVLCDLIVPNTDSRLASYKKLLVFSNDWMYIHLY